jgi:hypothetical protein
MTAKEELEQFTKLEEQVHASRREISELSKKKPNDAVNKFKLTHINRFLEKANETLGDDYALESFTQFDVDEVPTNSDVLFVLAQYTDALHRFRRGHTTYDGHVTKHYWFKGADRAEAKNPHLCKYSE